ncbi:S1-C subfamily serine protease [Deinobacterium chartae]|uniref:S1-C subfamily serine protease n=1 Tax=Deinobacterium chartae TaxID=521158 RepID=A0A841HXN1_9DEIO|nr:S1-C subfamily serine protease [Deinobacterium chartae]
MGNNLAGRALRALTLSLTGLVLLTSPLAGAQPAPVQTPQAQAPQNQRQAPQRNIGVASLSEANAALFRKAQPATFRLEHRSITDSNTPDGIGTGFFITKDGLALTAYHVVEGARVLSARTLSGERYPVEVVGFDAQADLAVVQVKASRNVPFLPLAASTPKVGQLALAIGNSRGQLLQPKQGRLLRLEVAADRADFPSGTLELDAPLAPGDSGGPILSESGEVIGVVSYIRLDDRERLRSYAIPVGSQNALLQELRAGTKRDVPALGITASNVLANIRFLPEAFPKLGLGPKPGAIFDGLAPNGPAARAGLRPVVPISEGDEDTPPQLRGDVITALNGKTVRSFEELVARVREHKVGETVKLTVQRGNQTVEISVQLEARAQVAF